MSSVSMTGAMHGSCCDPPSFEAECYEVAFPKENHQRLHDTLLNCQGYVMVSYNYCPYICELYHEFYIFRVVHPDSMSQTAGSEYEEVIITNYDPAKPAGSSVGEPAELRRRGPGIN